METTNTTQPNPNSKKHIRGWSLVSMLAAFVIGWAAAFVTLQVWHGTSRAKAETAVKPVVTAVESVVASAKKAVAPQPAPTEVAKPADAAALTASEPAPVAAVKAPAVVEPAAATSENGTDERAAIKKAFQRNIDTVRILTSR